MQLSRAVSWKKNSIAILKIHNKMLRNMLFSNTLPKISQNLQEAPPRPYNLRLDHILYESTTNRHYTDVIMSTMASQIASMSIVCSTVCSGADQRKHQSSASLAFVREIHRWPVDSPHKGPVTRKIFPFNDVIIGVAGTLSSSKNFGHPRNWEHRYSLIRRCFPCPNTDLLKKYVLYYPCVCTMRIMQSNIVLHVCSTHVTWTISNATCTGRQNKLWGENVMGKRRSESKTKN